MARKSKEEQRQADLLELKEILIEEKKRIIDHMRRIERDSDSGMNSIGGDEVDLASLELEQRTTARIGKRETKLLKKIDHALKKFGEGDDTGDYGICELTGEEIPSARLRARPVAQYTIEAKEELERKEGSFRDVEEEDSFEAEDES